MNRTPKVTCAAVAFAALLSPNTGQTADANGNYALRGAGSIPCSDYVTAIANDPAQAQVFVAWMAGYITARSRTAEDTFDVLPLISGADVAGLMRVVCVQNGDATFENAIDAALTLFAPARVKLDSPLLALEHNGRTISIREATLAEVQTALTGEGLYSSTVDGAFGPGTRTAIEQFQASRGLQVTGLPDADTLVALLLPAS
ncbi:putative peptidoglycan binding domain protein [Roseovarius mucosus]|uniref:Putative peptidoglycan binding domain protein n=1 Tax=Roseovarius mucosus TaxID=215743 RepID=A0A1V0RRQ1_9RHOB|nr:peptidoglycan-binding domain-containing protein [Roseovarius mucosus]ARE84376.1 putative peptidoglycan binding domain protein [Roseovarius mucosus]